MLPDFLMLMLENGNLVQLWVLCQTKGRELDSPNGKWKWALWLERQGGQIEQWEGGGCGKEQWTSGDEKTEAQEGKTKPCSTWTVK